LQYHIELPTSINTCIRVNSFLNFNEMYTIIKLEGIFQILVNFGLLIILVLILVPSGVNKYYGVNEYNVHSNYPNFAS
jgi:hypothetical protein